LGFELSREVSPLGLQVEAMESRSPRSRDETDAEGFGDRFGCGKVCFGLVGPKSASRLSLPILVLVIHCFTNGLLVSELLPYIIKGYPGG
jgi:hypothetical protein